MNRNDKGSQSPKKPSHATQSQSRKVGRPACASDEVGDPQVKLTLTVGPCCAWTRMACCVRVTGAALTPSSISSPLPSPAGGRMLVRSPVMPKGALLFITACTNHLWDGDNGKAKAHLGDLSLISHIRRTRVNRRWITTGLLLH